MIIIDMIIIDIKLLADQTLYVDFRCQILKIIFTDKLNTSLTKLIET